jgi:UDP-glucose 4-epimerase
MKVKHILITGGTGYIGSHTCIELLMLGHKITIFDNLSNSSEKSIERITEITKSPICFVKGDIRDRASLDQLLKNNFDAVIHFAGLKSVSESAANPLCYFDNNILGTINLLQAMAAANLKTLIFSSSATVYGDSNQSPIRENSPLSTTNPYGRSKLMIENILSDLHASDSDWNIARLRYFNPVGAHHSGLIGEDPHGMPNNLMPFISRVAAEKYEYLNIFGGDYPTSDGTGVRDYIHVVDLAAGHLKMLKYMEQHSGLFTVNLGTGRGYSVLEMVHAFEKACGQRIPYEICSRRPGDVAICYADVSLAKQLLGWTAKYDIHKMCEDTWRWQIQK